jgi:hypothetical protein
LRIDEADEAIHLSSPFKMKDGLPRPLRGLAMTGTWISLSGGYAKRHPPSLQSQAPAGTISTEMADGHWH